MAGEAEFVDDRNGVDNQNAKVGGPHRRQGIGSAMYVLAELVLGKPMVNHWDGDKLQSKAAR